jgi:hypothetical protein
VTGSDNRLLSGDSAADLAGAESRAGPGRAYSPPARCSGPRLNPEDGGPWSGLPDPSDHEAPDEVDDPPDLLGRSTGFAGGWAFAGGDDGHSDSDDYARGSHGPPILPWPAVPAALPSWPSRFARSQTPAPERSALSAASHPEPPAGDRIGTGLLDLTIPLAALAGLSAEPGRLSRLGSITATQASGLAALAALDPAVRWRVILTSGDGLACAMARIPQSWVGRWAQDETRAGPRMGGTDAHDAQGQRPAQPASQRATRSVNQWPAQSAGHGLVGRITITVPAGLLSADLGHSGCGAAGAAFHGTLGLIIEAALRVAQGAADRAAQNRASDAAVDGCAHWQASSGYQPAPSLREYVRARDQTCRFRTCRQPAMRCDLDHTIPWEKGGKTCVCNIGGLCRFHHRLKQRPGWHLTQPEPGVFTWATPLGRTYTTHPDPHG